MHRSPLAAFVDVVSDWAFASFALWVLLDYVATAAQLPAAPLLVVWLVTLPFVAFGLRRLSRSRPDRDAGSDSGDSDGDGSAEEPRPTTRWSAPVAAAVVTALALAAGVIMRSPHSSIWYLGWACAAAATAVTVATLWVSWPAAWPGSAMRHVPGLASDLYVAVTAVGCGVLSLFVLRTDADDAFYVNRAAAVADLDRIPYRDVLLGNGTYHAVAGAGAPVDAMAPLQGAVAHLIGVHGASVAYLVTPPVATFLGLWALWRLVREWAPRRPAACYSLGVVYLFMSGASHLSFGNFFLTRMWQGKVVFVTWALPTLLTYLTRWARSRDRLTAVLLVAGGITSIGLTASATIVAPLVLIAGTLPLLVNRQWRALVVPFGAAAFPLVAGFIGSRFAPATGELVDLLRPPPIAFTGIFAAGVVAAVAVVAMLVGPWNTRDRTAGLVAASSLLPVLLSLAPHLLAAVHGIIGLGGVLRRILWIAPAPAFVGLLASVRLPRLRVLSLAVPVAAAVLLVVFGTSILTYHQAHLVGSPTWKLKPLPKAQALAIQRHVHDGVLLAPAATMSAMAVVTADVKTVNPRSYYTALIPQPSAVLGERRLLTRFAQTGLGRAQPDAVARALTSLRVTTVCVHASHVQAVDFLHAHGYQDAFRAGDLRCVTGAPSA